MSKKISGQVRGLSPSEVRRIEKLADRRCDPEELVPFELARELHDVATAVGRRIGLLVTREGRIAEVAVGARDILYLPDLGRFRLGRGRLRRLRLVFSDLGHGDGPPVIPADVMADLEKLRLDAVVAVKNRRGKTSATFAHLLPPSRDEPLPPSRKEYIDDLARREADFTDFIENLEDELSGAELETRLRPGETPAVLVSVSDRSAAEVRASLDELAELARTAGVRVLERVSQRRRPDPKSVLGKGKLEEVVLRCLRIGAEMIVFDTELRPAQWRAVVNATELKVIDRSMLILDIFAQRAQSSEGRLQVELAQLKYAMPRLVEKDAGLSRLSGGIGGRGPGETKLEIGRRRIRERIRDLEKRVGRLSDARALRRKKRAEGDVPLVVIVGYTNVGKSTLFNRLTGSAVVAEDKLFATLDPFQRRVVVPDQGGGPGTAFVLSDTVGFIRDLPDEIRTAFRATLEELYEADLLVHVVDATDPLVEERSAAVEAVLLDMGLADVETVKVANKVDAAGDDDRPAGRPGETGPDGRLAVSAKTGEGLDELLATIVVRLGREPAAARPEGETSPAE